MSRTVSAGVGERLQYIAHKYNDNTIRFVLHYPGFLSADILCAATRAVIDRIDVLHASFLANRWRSCWQIHTDCQTSDYFAVIACAGDLAETADRIALQPIAHRVPCQMHVTLVNGASSSSIVVRVSHLVADGCDAKYLLGKLAEAYRLIGQTGTAAGLDVKNGSRSATLAYKHIGARKLFTFIKTPFTGVKTSYPFANPNTYGARSILSCPIPASTLGKAREKAKAEHATVNDLLLTALYRSYAQITGENGAISISAMMDLRQHCKNGDSAGLANMSGSMSTLVEAVTEQSFTATLQCVAAQTAAVKADPLAGLYGIPLLHTVVTLFPTAILSKAADRVYSNMSLSLTNLGNLSGPLLARGTQVPVAGLFGGPLKRKPSVQVGAVSLDGTAVLTILGDFTAEDVPSLQAFLDMARSEIERYLTETA